MKNFAAPAISATGVCKSFGEHNVLDHVDLAVAGDIPDELKRHIADGHSWLPLAARDLLISAATIRGMS